MAPRPAAPFSVQGRRAAVSRGRMGMTPTSVARPLYVRYVIALLAAIMLLNQLDRLVLSILVEPIRLELGLTDTQLGLLNGLAFAIFYTVCGIPLARLADTRPRPPLLAICIALWSGMTALCGSATSFSQLLLMRIG